MQVLAIPYPDFFSDFVCLGIGFGCHLSMIRIT